MTYNDEISLIDLRYKDENDDPYADEVGNNIPHKANIKRLCNVASASASEFYNAAVDSIKPAYVFTMHSYEYEEQERVGYKGKVYEVYRTYQTGTEEIELHVKAAIGIEDGET